jgi:hypothetical protein
MIKVESRKPMKPCNLVDKSIAIHLLNPVKISYTQTLLKVVILYEFFSFNNLYQYTMHPYLHGFLVLCDLNYTISTWNECYENNTIRNHFQIYMNTTS